jgi:16S rRNA (cytidine1402-2'-O)-methyltransferase
VRRGSLAELAAHYRGEPPRGEVVIVVGPPDAAAAPSPADIDKLLDAKLARLSLRDAVDELAAETGIARRALYERALTRQRGS